jgi:hypothetical protein
LSYPDQSSVMDRLHDETHRDLRHIRERNMRVMGKIWSVARRDLQGSIMQTYRQISPSGRWNYAALVLRGMEHLRMNIRRAMMQFHASSTGSMREMLKKVKRVSVLRHAWMLDQVTPESRKIKLPTHYIMHEAARFRSYTDWDTRWAGWCDAYSTALVSNIALGAINGSSITDAMDEVDATKAGSPSSSIFDSLARIMEYESMRQIAEGEDEIAGLNDDYIQTEVWKTRGDANVCDECADNEGATVEEADGDIPMHPWCKCFWQVVPKSYANLLRSGDSNDRALARQMEARGLVPTSMIIRDTEGNIKGKMIVNFTEWMGEQVHAITGRMS